MGSSGLTGIRRRALARSLAPPKFGLPRIRSINCSNPPDLFCSAYKSTPETPSMSLSLLMYVLFGIQGTCQVFEIPNVITGTVAINGAVKWLDRGPPEDISIVSSNID